MKGKLALLAAVLFGGVVAQAAPLGTAFTYQGRLDQNGQPANGIYQMTFWLYAASLGGSPIASNTVFSVPVNNGLFTTNVNFGPNRFTGEERWLAITVATNGSSAFTLLQPRTRLAPAPNAIYASTAGTVTNGAVQASQLGTAGLPSSGQVLGYNGTSLVWTNPTALSGAWSLAGNAAAGGDFLGTFNNLPLDVRVNNARALRLEPNATSPNVIGGWNGNAVLAGISGATIAGGGAATQFGQSASNRVTDNFGTIGGGAHNVAGNTNGNFLDAYYATVGGGYFNLALGIATTIAGGAENRAASNNATIGGGQGNRAYGDLATVAGGSNNAALAFAATIAGGAYNDADGDYSSVAGGLDNIAGYFASTIGGGRSNRALNTNATVGGGAMNIAGDEAATVAGGRQNGASGVRSTVGGGFSNGADGYGATVAGGDQNSARDDFGSVGGGSRNVAGYSGAVGGGGRNTASGHYSVVPGGANNVASGGFSFAVGLNAHATHESSYVFSSRSNPAYSFAPNRFQIHVDDGFAVDFDTQRADGGGARWVYIGRAVAGQQIATSTGAYLSDVGVWQNASDRNRKTDLAPVNAADVLRRLATLPISTWRYTNESSEVRHLGPTAQDFKAAFAIGADDKSIGTVDADGVALAAIQGLSQLVAEQKDRIAALEKQSVAQEQKLARWENHFLALEQAMVRTPSLTQPASASNHDEPEEVRQDDVALPSNHEPH